MGIGQVIILILSNLLILLAPVIPQILDLIIDFAYTVIHGCIVLVIENIMDSYMVKESMFTDKNDIVCDLITTYLPIFRTIAIYAMVVISGWQLLKTFFEYAGFSSEVEEPWKIGIKLILYTILVYESMNVCRYSIRIFERFIDVLDIKAFSFSFVGEWGETFANQFTGGKAGFDLGTGILKYLEAMGMTMLTSFAPKCIMYLVMIIVDFKILAVAIDFAEKYLQVTFLVIISPLSLACGVTKPTSQILTSWVKLFTGTLFSIFIKFLLVKILLEKVVIDSVRDTGTTVLDFVNMLRPITLIIAFTSIIEQSDQLVKELGFVSTSTTRKGSESLSRAVGSLM